MDKQRRNSLAVQLFDCCREVHEYYGQKVFSQVFTVALAHEMRLRGIRFRQKSTFDVHYKGIKTDQKLIADFVVEDAIVLEICTESQPVNWHETRLQTLMFFAGTEMGILIDPAKTKMIDGFKKINNPKIFSI